MELTCILVFTLASLVTATPHGYGVKGGALAKADASAVAGSIGNFGAIPLSIPSSGSYSGSYSKSSASSFASSSASSSSSSFSFSGAGAGGLATNNLSGLGTHGITSDGCKNADCHSSGSTRIPDDSGSTGVSGSKSGAVAFSGISSKHENQEGCTTGQCSNGTPVDCSGSECDDTTKTNHGCISGQCDPVSTTGGTQHDSKNKCISGQCSPSYQSGPSATSYGSNDIPVNTAGSKTESNTNHQSTDYNKETTGQSNYVTGNAVALTHNKPATYLTTPKENTPCTSSNCETPIGSVYDKANLPSSYNVPIHGASPSLSSQSVPCSSGNCGVNPSSSNGCTTGNCANSDHSSKNPDYSYGSSPNYTPTGPTGQFPPTQTGIHPSSSPSKYPTYSQSSAPLTNTGTAAGITAPSGVFTIPKPSNPANLNNQKLPPYTGGFGGPPGILKPNEFSHGPIPISNKPSGGSYSPALCTSGNCGTQPTSYPSGSVNQIPYKPTAPTGSYYPSTCSSGFCGNQPGQSPVQFDQSSPTSGFGGPAGILKPNDFGVPAKPPTSNYKPSPPAHNYNPPGLTSPQNNYPIAPSGHNNNIACSLPGGNCGSQHGPSISSKPITGSYNPSISCSSGKCDTQPGHVSHNPLPPLVSTSPAFGQSVSPIGLHQKPISQSGTYNPNSFSKPTAPATGFYNPVTCSSGNCNSEPGHIEHSPVVPASPTFGQNVAPVESQPKPISPIGTYNPTVCSSGNCGSQHGQSSSQPGHTGAISGTYYKPTVPAGALCTSGNCGSQSGQPLHDTGSTQLNSPGYNPDSCRSGNCGNKDSHNLNGAPSATHPTSPSGIYNPTSSSQIGQSTSAQSTTTGIHSPVACAFGNCESQPNHGDGTHTVPTAVYNPINCASGNCGTHSGSGNGAHATSSAVANAVVYTGGFGGPPGLLKPYDDGKLVIPSSIGKYSSTSVPGSHYTGPHSLYGKSINNAGSVGLTGSAAQASSLAGAAAGSYSGGKATDGHNSQAGTHGTESHKESGCKEGCGSNGGGSFGLNSNYGSDGSNIAVAAAKSIASAGAGSYGQGRSFASSSATAHASASAGTKGGYGRR